jgi:rhodanese-related sulfurtransferase
VIADLFLASALLVGQAGTSPHTAISAASAVPPTEPAFPELTGDQAWDAFRSGVLFLDARQRSDYVNGHVPGALNLPLWAKDFEDQLMDFLTNPKVKPTNPAVLYCSGCCSTDSLFLAQRLKEVGFTRIQIYRDGYPGWLRAERPHVLGDSTEVK